MKEMKTISFNGQQYEIVDATARTQINALNEAEVIDTTARSSVQTINETLANAVFQETGTINARAAYTGPGTDNASLEKWVKGTYSLMGNYCFVSATADLISGWGSVYYHLPVAEADTYIDPKAGADTIGFIYKNNDIIPIKIKVA